MKKVVFLANFVLALLEVMSMPTDDFNRNVRHNNVDMCQGLHLTQTETEDFLKSRKEKELRNKQDIQLSQQINEMFNSQQPQDPIDEDDNLIYESQYLTADEEINRYWNELNGITSFSFVNSKNRSRSKIFDKRKTNGQGIRNVQLVGKCTQSEIDREGDPLYSSDDEDFDAFLKSLSQTHNDSHSSSPPKSSKNQSKIFTEQNRTKEEKGQRYVQYYGKNQKSVAEINPFKVTKDCQQNEQILDKKGSSNGIKAQNRKLRRNTMFINQSIDKSITSEDQNVVSKSLFNTPSQVHRQKRKRIALSSSEKTSNQSEVIHERPKTKAVQTRERNIINKWLNKIRTNSEKEIIEELKQMKDFRRKKKINVKDENGSTPLITAVEMGKSELVEYLLESGAEVNAKDNNEKTALFYALQSNNENLAKVLINNGSGIEILNQNNIFERFDPMICGRLIVYGTKINNEVIDLKNLVLSGQSYKTELDNLVKIVNIKNFKLMDDLFIELIERGNLEIVEQLINAGINVNAEDTVQEKALIVALENGYTEIAKLLIKNHADINARSADGNTALMIALEKGYADIVGLLIRKKQDINAQNENGDTSLIIAVNKAKGERDIENIEKLIKKRKADINIQNKDGHTALIRAVIKGGIDVIKLLLKNGSDINIRNKNGKSELLKALNTRNNKAKIIELLVDNCSEVSNFQELKDYLSKPIVSQEERIQSSLH